MKHFVVIANAYKDRDFALTNKIVAYIEQKGGTLSGIRPTKIAMKCIEDGMSDKETYDYLKETYLASDEKIDLSIGIAKREKALLDKVDYDNGYSLYIGIPFCPSTCAYCSFTSYPLGVWKNRVDDYLDALEKEIDYTAQKFYQIGRAHV